MLDINKLRNTTIKLIVEAQRASDAGKGIDEIYGTNFVPLNYGYSVKDNYILSAIKNIQKFGKAMNIKYYVRVMPDQNGNVSSVCYFKVYDGERWLQVSFHAFSKELLALDGMGTPMHWEQKKGSRRNCLQLSYALKMYLAE